jgi:catechol-2,3-dioxygenase
MSQGNIKPVQPAENPIDPGVRIGHVHLRTADIDRVRDFCRSLEAAQRGRKSAFAIRRRSARASAAWS